jgi:ABC-2 type transport system ATP-binding protein
MTVEVSQLLKRYGTKVAVNIPSWRIEAGEMVGLVGSNGAGKTTLLRLILDLLKADTGEVRIAGQPVAQDIGWKARTGSFLDESFLIDYLTADEFFDFVGSIYGLSKPDLQQALEPYRAFYPDEVLGQTTKFIRELSKGNGKKIGIIAAMFINPALLLLDEPFANLDPPSQIRLMHLLKALNARCGTTMIISSHDLIHVTGLCQRITLVDQGRIVRDTQTSETTLRELEAYFTV